LILPVAVARSYDGVAILYVLPVLWMTSCFHTVESVGLDQIRRYMSKKFAGGGTGWTSDIYSVLSSVECVRMWLWGRSLDIYACLVAEQETFVEHTQGHVKGVKFR